MTYRELRRKLERLGCRFDRQASGSHEIWLNPTNERETPIPRHGNRDLATLEPSTESAETWESPGRTLTRHSPLHAPSLGPLATPPSTTKNARQMQTSKERVSQFSKTLRWSVMDSSMW